IAKYSYTLDQFKSRILHFRTAAEAGSFRIKELGGGEPLTKRAAVLPPDNERSSVLEQRHSMLVTRNNHRRGESKPSGRGIVSFGAGLDRGIGELSTAHTAGDQNSAIGERHRIECASGHVQASRPGKCLGGRIIDFGGSQPLIVALSA